MAERLINKDGAYILVDASAVIVKIDNVEMSLDAAISNGKIGQQIEVVNVLDNSSSAVPTCHAVNAAIGAMVDDIDEEKQDKLQAGTGIVIEDNVISAVGGSGGSVTIDTSIPSTPSDAHVPSTKLMSSSLANKQNKLTAGDNITISADGTISCTFAPGTAQTASQVSYQNSDGTSTNVQAKLTELDSIGKYNSIGEFIPNNPLSSLTSSLSYASIFRTWGIVGASFETSYSQGYKVDTKESASFYDDVDDDVVKWTKIFAQVNGVKVADYCQAGATLYGLYTSRLGQLLNNGAKEAYIFNMNGNDITTSKYNKEIGTFDDINLDDYEQNADTWYGLIGKYIQRTRATAPRAYIFFGTVRKSGTPNDRTIQMINAIKDIATHFSHVYTLDMNTYGIDWSDSNVRNAYVSITHPNRLGHIYLFKAFNTYIDWYIKKNPIEMRDALFISHEEYKDTNN